MADRTREINRTASKKHYGSKGFDIQKDRLYRGIIAGTRTHLTPATVEKYNIEFDDDGEVIIPEKYKKQKEEVVVKENPITLADVYNFFATDYRTKDGNRPSQNTINTKYRQLGTVLRKATGQVIDTDSTNIVPIVRDADMVLKGIREAYDNINTIVLQIEKVLTAVDNYVPLKEQIDESIIQKYRHASRDARGDTIEQTINDTDNKKVYNWAFVKELVKKAVGANSIEYLYLLTYEYVPVRDELAGLPLFKSDDKGNYAKLNKTGIKIILRDFKTRNKYEPKEYILPRGLSSKLFEVLGSDSKVLFPEDIHSRIKSILDKKIYFPFGEGENNQDYNFSTGLRHTLVAFRNSPFNKLGLPKGKELAKLMLHSQGTAELVYRNKGIFERSEGLKK